MRSSKKEFPNPILSADCDDYINCYFNIIQHTENIAITQDSIIIPVLYELLCDSLYSLISTGKAEVIISIQSSATSFRRMDTYQRNQTAIEITLPKYSVSKRVDIVGLIVASEAIKHFSCNELNNLYFENATFDIRKGDILARTSCISIPINDDELEKPLTSIFTITAGDNQVYDVVPDFSDEKIVIYLKNDLYTLYCNLKDFNNGSLRRYLTGVVVYPVLVEAIAKIYNHYKHNDESDIENKRWFKSIEHKADKENIDLSDYDDPFSSLANHLLGEIAIDSIKSIKDTMESELNSGEEEMIGGVD